MSETVEDALVAVLGRERVSSTALDRHVRAHDASHYLLIPEIVAEARSTNDVAQVLRCAAVYQTPVTFRSGGTSLAGQASGEGILLDTRAGFRKVTVYDNGERIQLAPGVTLRTANARLLALGRSLGPDPASDIACTVGGVIANNSSGMAAGIELNSYRTIESLVAVLTSGTIIDSAAPDAAELLRTQEPELVSVLEQIRDRIQGSPELVAEIRERFSMKNTMGYSMNAFIDYSEPLDILVHLLIGSEGTLGFVADSVFRTVPVERFTATGLLVFESVELATRALPIIVGTGAAAIELMDSTSLNVARRTPNAPAEIHGFELAEHAAFLVEYRGSSETELLQKIAEAVIAMTDISLVNTISFTRDAERRAALWHVRKGLYATVAENRPSGTTALLEDVVVPVDELAAVCDGLAALISRFEYPDGVIFGHAKDGNLHFMVTDDFSKPGAVERLDQFTDELADLILSHGGNLKAEHGTGRAMASYVPRQYSEELVDAMRELKRAFDPEGILNPGVVLTHEPSAHLQNLKPAVTIEAEVDRCVECGYCEPVCPSRDLTLTPRQRIVARRARVTAEAAGDTALVAELDRAYEYEGVQTCAVDGMCQVACPVGINTGDLVRRLRRESHGAVAEQTWKTAAQHWSAATRGVAAALTVAAQVPEPVVAGPNKLVRRMVGADTVPLHTPDLPRGGARRSNIQPASTAPVSAVFMPSCQGAMFAGAGGGSQRAFLELCDAAGVAVRIPDAIDGVCCGTPWASKGFDVGGTVMRERLLDAVYAASDNGQLPVVVDATSCTEGVEKVMRKAMNGGDHRAISVVDGITFIVENVLPLLPELAEQSKLPSLTLHPTCSSVQLGVNSDLERLARSVARDVNTPVDWACCGFAGDRGMLHPELTASATQAEAAEVRALDSAAHVSCNRACEIAMTRATGREYEHILELMAKRFKSA